jgi:hypothetical protein
MGRARVALLGLLVGVAASMVHAQKHSIAYRCCFNETIAIPFSSFDWNPSAEPFFYIYALSFFGLALVQYPDDPNRSIPHLLLHASHDSNFRLGE